MNILLTGSFGYIGSGIFRSLIHKHNIICINRQIFDLRDSEATKNWFSNINKDIYFDTVIHTAIKGGNRLEQDSSDILDDNLRMYFNLLNNRDRYNKFINIGSGAEQFSPDSFYGLSKKTINSSILDKKNFYNLRIYAIFDENELDRRFIKNSIKKYLNKENIIVHADKYMDFIYFPDFINIVQKYLEYDNLPKTLDCVYEQKYTLMDIAKIINGLDDHRVEIEVKNLNNDTDYTGKYYNINVQHKGLVQGILETYRKLNNEKSMVCAK